MNCAKCKQVIEGPYRHEPGLGDVHKICPTDTQLALSGDDEPLPVDGGSEQYPD